jgi:hypothetical protein
MAIFWVYTRPCEEANRASSAITVRPRKNFRELVSGPVAALSGCFARYREGKLGWSVGQTAWHCDASPTICIPPPPRSRPGGAEAWRAGQAGELGRELSRSSFAPPSARELRPALAGQDERWTRRIVRILHACKRWWLRPCL